MSNMTVDRLNHFMISCDQVAADLYKAQNTEMLDAATSNYTFSGWIISSMSRSTNHYAADKLDRLQQEAVRINQELTATGIFQRGVAPLPTDFNGAAIRTSEEAEHSFLANWLTSSRYSSCASMNTLQQINCSLAKVQQVRSQAAHLANALLAPSRTCMV